MKHLLVLGCGSVGKRHARNLAGLGCRISCFDPREDRRAEMADETPLVNSFAELDAALGTDGIDGVVVASPTLFHPEQTIKAVQCGLPVLLEKPPAKTLAEAQAMAQAAEQAGVPVLLGYTWRWWPPLLRVRELLESGCICKPLHVQFHMSAHLADWHPWEPYQEFFMASSRLGGGALLDESHWIDLMLWLFGQPQSLYGQVEKNTGLEIETDDNVDVILNYPNGLRITMHLDLYGRPHEKFIRFIGDRGTILWTADPNRISIGNGMEQQWQHEEFKLERNDMFVAVAREFISVLEGTAVQSCSLADGIRVMEIIEAVRQSHHDGQLVKIG